MFIGIGENGVKVIIILAREGCVNWGCEEIGHSGGRQDIIVMT